MSCPRPKRSLGLTPLITTMTEFLLALSWIAFLRTTGAARKATFDEQLQKLKADHAKDSELKIGKEKIDAGTYLKAIETAVSRWVNDNKSKLFIGSKTHTTPVATVSARAQQPQLVITDEETAAERLIEQFDLQPELDRLRSEFPEAFRYLKVSFDLDKQGLMAAYKANQITDEQLQQHGIKVEQPEDETITIKV